MSVVYWIGIVGLGLWTVLNVVGAYELFSDSKGRRSRRLSRAAGK